MTITNTFDKSCKSSLPELYLGCKHLNQADVYKYLGHYVSNNLLDDKDIIRQTQANYAKGNMLCQNFKDCSDIVKCLLFKSYMFSMYSMNLWCHYSKSVPRKFVVSYNNAFWYLFTLAPFCRASVMLVNQRVHSIPEVNRIACNSLFQRVIS